MSERSVDFDSPWKETLEYYFEDFMAFFFQQAYANIDWSRGYEFLDKELQQVVRDAGLGRRFADKLVKVWRKSGEEQWVLIHVEVQGQQETDFSKRMYTYNYRLFDRYNRPIVSLAVLTDQRARWRPRHYGYDLWGCKIAFTFPVVKLLDYRKQWTELETSNNPFAVVIMAHLKAQDTKRNAQERQVWKLSLTRRLYEHGYKRQDVLNLFHFIDWVMQLPTDLDKSFWQQVHEFEKERQMPYISSVDRMATQEGLEQGRQEGRQEGMLLSLLHLLQYRFGPASEELQARLQQFSAEQLTMLLDVALTTNSTAEFVAQLPSVLDAKPETQNQEQI